METLLCQPILVETNEITDLWTYKNRNLYYNTANFNDEDDTTYYKLVLISIDKDIRINYGDLFVSRHNVEGLILSNKWILCKADNNFIKNYYIPNDNIHYKIIVNQEQLPTDYIEQFVNEFNNNKIQNVNIKIENCGTEDIGSIGNEERVSTTGETFIIGFRPILINNNVIITTYIKYEQFSFDDMNDFALWYSKNNGQFDNELLSLNSGEYIKKWLKSKK